LVAEADCLSINEVNVAARIILDKEVIAKGEQLLLHDVAHGRYLEVR
jgi:hypothetical protein